MDPISQSKSFQEYPKLPYSYRFVSDPMQYRRLRKLLRKTIAEEYAIIRKFQGDSSCPKKKKKQKKQEKTVYLTLCIICVSNACGRVKAHFIRASAFSSVQFSCSVVSDSLRPYGLQQARHPCPLSIPGVYSNSCPLSR